MKPQKHNQNCGVAQAGSSQDYLYYHRQMDPVKKNFQSILHSNSSTEAQLTLNAHKSPSRLPKQKGGMGKNQCGPKECTADSNQRFNIQKRNECKDNKQHKNAKQQTANKLITKAKNDEIQSLYYNRQRHNALNKQRGKQKASQATQLSKIMEVTFSLDSTEPEADEQQIVNQYQLPQKQQSSANSCYQKSSNPFLNAFRKKLIVKQIEQKQQAYRHYIRSESRSRDKDEKYRIKSRMKDVLNQMYQLKKLIRE